MNRLEVKENYYLDDKEDEAHNLLQQRFYNPSSGFHCDGCEFVDKNEQGLNPNTKYQHKAHSKIEDALQVQK